MGKPICISVINMKGGVGKTTIAALLSSYASWRLELDVLAVDLDPQANLSQTLMREVRYRQFLDQRAPSIVELFRGYQPPTGGTTSPSQLDINNIAIRNTRLGREDLELLPSRFDFSENLVGSLKPDPRILARLVAHEYQHKDLVLIDCAPTESILTRAAYHASRYILVPVRPEFLATIGFPLLSRSLEGFRRENQGHEIDVLGIVVNNSSYLSGNDGGPEKQRAIEDLRQEADRNGWKIFDSEIPFSRGFPRIMRGNYTWLGNAVPGFRRFAQEFFAELGY